MRIAVASGKGGSGKTTVALNLALAFGGPVQLLDCDVEEPNLHIFFEDLILNRVSECRVFIPEIEADRCNSCGACSDFCRYGAIAALASEPVFFPELCHGCGGCMYVCPQQAIREASRVIGVTRDYQSSQVRLISGHLNPSERMGVPLVRKVKRQAHSSDLVIIDAPPGSSCPMVAAVQDADVLVLVAEPTPFGVSDLNLVIEVAAKLGLPYGVVINRCDIGDDCLYRMCQDSGIPILAQIPNERSIAVAYSKGIPLLKALPDFKPLFQDLLSKIIDVVPNDSQSQRRYVC